MPKAKTHNSPAPEAQPMHAHIKERCALAVAYAEDGAYLSALRVLHQVHEDTRAHVGRLQEMGML